jgi:hypothetical protein
MNTIAIAVLCRRIFISTILHPRAASIHHPLNFVELDRIIAPVVQAGRACRFVAGHLLRHFQLPAVLQIGGDTGGAKAVATDLGDCHSVDPNEQFATFKASLEAPARTITYYAPIEWVYFGKDTIRFGEFEIRRLKTAEMGAIFSDRIRRIFYPWSRVGTTELAGYWFLIAKETMPVDPPGKSFFRIRVRVDPHRPRFSTPIDRALSLLALGDWAKRRPPAPDGTPQKTVHLDTAQWPLPELVPFIISVSTNFLESPRRAADTSVLNRVDNIDAQTGEAFDSPDFQLHWDAAKADEFERLLASALRALDAIRPHEQQWTFIAVALRFLGRAFTSDGIESLLWNMTAVDALLGENKLGTKARLSARVGKMLGGAHKAKFEALYEIRSDLVHGNAEFKHKVILNHLGTAREFARLSALWMLSYLAAVAQAVDRLNCPVPDRAELLAILDGSPSALTKHRSIADDLPNSFPKVQAWLTALAPKAV